MSKSIIIDGKEYVPADSVKNAPAESVKGMKYVIVRGYQSGVWAGYLKERKGTEAIVLEARNIWYWKGAASLAQLSQEGIKNLKESKITQPIPEFTMVDCNSVFPCTQKAKENLEDSPVWKA